MICPTSASPFANWCLLFGVPPFDPLTLAAAVGLLLAVTILAAWLPARRAARIDPLQALRAE